MAFIPDFAALGRLPAPDERDKLFSLRKAIPVQVSIISKYWNSNGWWGDQGPYPYCVGFSWTHWVEDGPVTHKGKPPIVDPVVLYKEAQKIDEWPGEQYDGTSVRAGAKYLQSKGLISEYRWAWDLQTLIDAVLTIGPVVVGTNWYNDMFYPNNLGVISIGGQIAGGHAWIINGVNTKTKYFRMKNSWGREWGKKGYAYIRFADMERLILEDGEVCLGFEKQLPTDL